MDIERVDNEINQSRLQVSNTSYRKKWKFTEWLQKKKEFLSLNYDIVPYVS